MTTRLAVLADIHADADALRETLGQGAWLGCRRIVCAGDLVDYGSGADETIQLLLERNVSCVRGNHDRWVVEYGRTGTVGPVDDLGQSTAWLDLSPPVQSFLEAPQPAWDGEIAGTRVAVRHGRPRSDMDAILPDDLAPDDARSWLELARADVLLIGHTHCPFAVSTLGGGLIANPGSVLRRGGSGTFGMLQLPSRRFTVHRVEDGIAVEIPRATLGVRDRRG